MIPPPENEGVLRSMVFEIDSLGLHIPLKPRFEFVKVSVEELFHVVITVNFLQNQVNWNQQGRRIPVSDILGDEVRAVAKINRLL